MLYIQFLLYHVGRRGRRVTRGQDVNVQPADLGRHELPQELPAHASHGGPGQIQRIQQDFSNGNLDTLN